MDVFILLVILGAVSLAVYTVFACKKWGCVPPSLSDTYYKIKRQGFFTLALAVGVFATLPPALEVSQPKWQFLIFLSMVGMLFVAAAPRFRTKGEEIQRRIHMTGAAILLICATAWSTIHQPWSLLGWPIPLLLILIRKCQKGKPSTTLFWVEVAVMLQLYAALFLELTK